VRASFRSSRLLRAFHRRGKRHLAVAISIFTGSTAAAATCRAALDGDVAGADLHIDALATVTGIRATRDMFFFLRRYAT